MMIRRLTILLFSFALSGCTIVGNFYLLNNSKTDLQVIINVRTVNKEVAENYLIRIDDNTGKRINYSSYKRMGKRSILLDATKNQFQFSLLPNEYAHIGFGPNTRIWNVKNILITKDQETIELIGSSYNQFELRKTGLFRYVGIKQIYE